MSFPLSVLASALLGYPQQNDEEDQQQNGLLSPDQSVMDLTPGQGANLPQQPDPGDTQAQARAALLPTTSQATVNEFPQPDYSQRDALLGQLKDEMNRFVLPLPGAAAYQESRIRNLSGLLGLQDRFTNSDYENQIRAYNARKSKLLGQTYDPTSGHMIGTFEGPEGISTQDIPGVAPSIYNRGQLDAQKEQDRETRREIARMNNLTAQQKIQMMQSMGVLRSGDYEARTDALSDIAAANNATKLTIAGMPARSRPGAPPGEDDTPMTKAAGIPAKAQEMAVEALNDPNEPDDAKRLSTANKIVAPWGLRIDPVTHRFVKLNTNAPAFRKPGAAPAAPAPAGQTYAPDSDPAGILK